MRLRPEGLPDLAIIGRSLVLLCWLVSQLCGPTATFLIVKDAHWSDAFFHYLPAIHSVDECMSSGPPRTPQWFALAVWLIDPQTRIG